MSDDRDAPSSGTRKGRRPLTRKKKILFAGNTLLLGYSQGKQTLGAGAIREVAADLELAQPVASVGMVSGPGEPRRRGILGLFRQGGR